MAKLIETALKSPNISIFGTYTHANFSYNSRDIDAAAKILALEIRSANDCAKQILEISDGFGGTGRNRLDPGGLRLAVGATPTAHAAHKAWKSAREKAGVAQGDLVGRVEL